jgi:Mg2+-importing ATPase
VPVRTARFVEVTAARLTLYRVTAGPRCRVTTLPWLFFATLVLFTIVYLVLVEVTETVFEADPMHLTGQLHRSRGHRHRRQRRAARFSRSQRIARPHLRLEGRPQKK